MKLASVRALKEELLSVPETLLEHVATARAFSAFTSTRRTVSRAMDRIALGVTKTRKQHRLAVRLQQASPVVSAMADEIRRRAKNEVDVQFVGRLVKRAGVTQPAYYRMRRRPLRIGQSISDVHTAFTSAGTLGCFVVGRQSPHYLSVLTNNHVIANENGNSAGSPIVQQGTLDGGELPDDLIGELGKFVKLHATGANQIDAALGDLDEELDFDARQIGSLGNLSGKANVADLPAQATVYKVGRTTGQTKGRITAFEIDNVIVEYDMGLLRFDNQIEIEGSGTTAFSDSGDSGSLIVDENLKAIGLLFAGGDEGGSNGKGLTYANPIQTVLDALKVDLEL